MTKNNKNRFRYRRLKHAVAALALASALPAVAKAASIHMQTGGATSQPIGHYNYCRQNFGDCNLRSGHGESMKLTRARWKQMVSANSYANRKVRPVTDQEYYGVEELWTLPVAYGDCEDFVLLKRRMLMDMGWPASSLLVTVVRQKNGDGHAVLTVRTDRADYVLDNLQDKILPWHETEYTYLKRQSQYHSGRWTDIVDTRSVVGTVSVKN